MTNGKYYIELKDMPTSYAIFNFTLDEIGKRYIEESDDQDICKTTVYKRFQYAIHEAFKIKQLSEEKPLRDEKIIELLEWISDGEHDGVIIKRLSEQK